MERGLDHRFVEMRGIPRNHYLLVHDALRKLCGSSSAIAPSPKLAAFVRQRHPFQCDMLINSRATDPDNFQPQLEVPSSHPSSLLSSSSNTENTSHTVNSSNRKGRIEAYHSFLYALQRELGLCNILPGPHIARVDIQFADQSLIHLALGAALEDLPMGKLPGSEKTSTPGTSIAWSSQEVRAAAALAVNTEPSRLRRARLRVSLGGFDEALFIDSAPGMEKLTAQKLCEWTHDYVLRTPAVWSTHPTTRTAPTSTFSRDLLLPPYYFWLAHVMEAMNQYQSNVKNHMDLMRIVQSHFISVFDGLPLSNPFFPGEDLNTLPEVQWWGLLFQAPAEAANIHHRIVSTSFSSSVRQGCAAGTPATAQTKATTLREGVVELDLSTKKLGEPPA